MSADHADTTSSELLRTPLHALHLALGARMVPFAGYEMPVQYRAGVLKEHVHTRSAAGLFDVSHMGQITLRPRSGTLEVLAHALETLVPIDVVGLAPGRQRYALLTDEAGGIRDDLMIANRGDHFLLVVNAAAKVADMRHIEANLASDCEIELNDRALLALQGPKAESALAALTPRCASLRFMDVTMLDILGASCVVARSGYTGEDGFEISTPAEAVHKITEALLSNSDVQPIGLGARDTLRLEAGLPLCGSDIDATTNPVEAGLAWSIPSVRRAGGARAGGFPGAAQILAQLACGPSRRRVGLRPDGRAPVREGAPVFLDAASQDAAGIVTSGSFGPTVEAPIAMGYVPAEAAAPGTRLFAEVRGKRLAVTVAELPFVPHRYKRA